MVQVTQITYSDQRRELQSAQGELQLLMQQALVSHVHSGIGNEPSQINLTTELIINVPIIQYSNAFTFTYPTGFAITNYSSPQVYLNSTLLQATQYGISSNIIFLQNQVPITDTLQIIYPISPGPVIYITNTLTPPLQDIILNYQTVYYLTDGTTNNTSGGQQFNVFQYDASAYSEIDLYLNNQILDPTTYVLNPIGLLRFNGPILPSIENYNQSQVIIRFVTPEIQVTGVLPSNRIKSISANSISRGIIPSYRINGLDHLGFIRIDEPANIIPYKKLLDSGDHIHFYPEIDSSPIQHSDDIIYSNVTQFLKIIPTESTTPYRTIVSTPNGLFATQSSQFDYADIKTLPWNTDNGVPDEFSENYFGNFITYQIPVFIAEDLNPKDFWLLTKSINQFVNLLYVSTDYGQTYSQINLPLNLSNEIVTINDFIYTVNVFELNATTANPSLDVNYIYYLAGTDGLYMATLTSTQAVTQPIWTSPNNNTTNAPTGSINKISEAVNIGTIITTSSGGSSTTTYYNYRTLYASCDTGLFIFSVALGSTFNSVTGNLFITNSLKYNVNSSSFNYVQWLGIYDESNSIYSLVWGDNYGIYYSNSGQYLVRTSSTQNSSTITTYYYEPLTISQTNLVTAQCATIYNINLTQSVITIDGYSLVDGNTVLVKNQTIFSQNGIYIWSSTTQLLYNINAGPSKVYVKNGSQSETEWIDLNVSATQRTFALWFANIIDLSEDDYIVGTAIDMSNGPGSYAQNNGYYHSFFVATTQYIYRVLNYTDPCIYPVVLPVMWDVSVYGTISNIQHYASEDIQNGMLVVLTSNGIYQSTPGVFSNTLGAEYQRFINVFSATESANASVYDDYTQNQYIGKITSIGLSTNLTALTNGSYLNLPVFANNTSGQGLSVDITALNGLMSVGINQPGFNYTQDVISAFVNIDGQIINLQNAITEGIFAADSNTQAFTYSAPTGINPSRLLYEVDYTTFYIQPWIDYPIITIKINNIPVNLPFTYTPVIGQIVFNQSLSLQQQVTVTLSNVGQYISNTGNTPHLEVFNILSAESIPAATLSSTYGPTTATNNILPLNTFNDSLWNASITVVKITGMRSITSGSNVQVAYTEIVQVSVNIQAQIVYIISKPTTLQLTQGSNVYICVLQPDVYGIEDEITLYKSGLTYHLDSVSHANVYNLYNTLINAIPDLFEYQTYPNEVLTGVNRGLQNTITLSSLSDFDPSATFIGYSFGVTPSASDSAAAPSTINLIIDFNYGNNPVFATNQGIFQYIRSIQSWIKVDSVGDSQLIYFANISLTDSTNTSYVFSGTNTGLYYQSNGIYIQNPLFTEPTLSISMGEWYSSTLGETQRYEAYGQNDVMSFVLRTANSGTTTLQSDYFAGHTIYDIYYNVFFRTNDQDGTTSHPALYLATDYSVWAFTTDPGTNASAQNGPDHTLLFGREMFGPNILRNINPLNSLEPGTPVKVFTIFPLLTNNDIWLIIGTSNGIYVIINWQQCDVGSPNGLNFYPQNLNYNNETIGHSCYVIVAKSNDLTNSIYFSGTDVGVFKSTNQCYSWYMPSNFAGSQLSVNDLKYILDSNNNGYLVATTNLGLWVSSDDGDSWQTIQSISDLNIEINSLPFNGFSLDKTPSQTFSAQTSGQISKAFAYLDTNNLTGLTTVNLSISNGSLTTQSESITFNQNSFSGMYGFGFTNTQYNANQNYKLGVTTDGSIYSSQIVWELSNLSNPFAAGYASTLLGQLTNQDFYFLIDLNTPASPTQVIEPVGFYDTSYPVGFASGTWSGASISTNGYLYSNVGVICNVVLDNSRSFEINDQGIITQSGVSTGYVMQAIINALVPNGSDTDSLYARLCNTAGISKLLVSVYGFTDSINDLLFAVSNTTTNEDCFSTEEPNYDGYTNDPTLVQSSISYVTNNGRLSFLYDAVQFNSRLQFPAVISGFYSQSLSLVDFNFINVQSVKLSYQSNFEFYLSLNLIFASANTYNIVYQNNSNNFVWVGGTYAFALVIYSNGTCAIPNNFSPTTGVLIDTSGLTPTNLILSKSWVFDTSICDLADQYTAWSLSEEALNFALQQYSQSFKPLIIVSTDGNDNSTQSTPIGVNSSLQVAWQNGTQVLVVEPENSGNEIDLRTMIEGTNSQLFTYDSYPEQDIKNILFVNDTLDLFTSYWTRNYDFDSPVYISYIYALWVTPGNSIASVEFQWSKDRINFSNFIPVINGQSFYLNQQVLTIFYKVKFTEDYQNGTRLLPFVKQLYHVSVIPSIQTYLSYPQTVSGQLFETLASASFSNSQTSQITPIVLRSASADTTYAEIVQLNRNGCLPNRQSSFRIRAPYTVTGLLLLPVTNVATNVEYYIVDSNNDLYTWGQNDTFILYGPQGAPVNPSAYNVIAESGIILISGLYSLVNGKYLFTGYVGTLEFAEEQSSIVGEPCTTSDYKTYYLLNGRLPVDCVVIVLINQVIFKGTYEVDYYNGSVTFATSLEVSDYVTVFVKFADVFRAGLQISSYSSDNISLESFNFTYTSIADGPTLDKSFLSLPPYIENLQLIPSFPVIDSLLQLNYQYLDATNSPESDSTIQWWRNRNGIEYATFNSNLSLPVSGQSIVGLNTFTVTSLYNQNAYPFILSCTINSVGNSTTLTQVKILDRGSNFIGTSTALISTGTISITTSQTTFATVPLLGLITAFTLSHSYYPNFITTSGFVRINPDNLIGYAVTTYGFSTSAQIVSFPNYDGRLSERMVDVGAQTVFDGRDSIMCVVIPSNAVSSGQVYNSNIATIQPYYTPTANGLTIVGAMSSNNGISTLLYVNGNVNQIPMWNFYYPQPNYTQTSYLSWFDIGTMSPILLSNAPILSSSLISLGQQIFFSVYPSCILADGVQALGQTCNSPVFSVST